MQEEKNFIFIYRETVKRFITKKIYKTIPAIYCGKKNSNFSERGILNEPESGYSKNGKKRKSDLNISADIYPKG